MAKLDGMDPKLVRELLAEVTRAGRQMETVEAKVSQFTRTAGVAIRVTHRPSQVADAGAVMVKDVGARLELLEKREKQDPPRSPGTKPADDPSANDTTVPRDDPKPAEDPKKPDSPASGSGDKPGAKESDRPESNSDGEKPHKPDSKDDTDKPTKGESEKPDNDKPPTKGESEKPEADKPPTKGESEKPEADKPPTKGESEKPEADKPPTKGETEKPEADKPPTKGETEKPEGDKPPSKGETEKPPSKGEGEVPPSDCDDRKSGGDGVVDTPRKDHPDDMDQTKGRQVVIVDGVKVVTTPLNQPSDEYLAWLDRHMDQVAPVDAPTLDGDGIRIVQPDGGGAHPSGPAGMVQPTEPTVPADPPKPGLAPGDPEGAYIGTPEDNLTEDPAAGSRPTVDPARLSPGDQGGAGIGTPGDNLIQEPPASSVPADNPVQSPDVVGPTTPAGDSIPIEGGQLPDTSTGTGNANPIADNPGDTSTGNQPESNDNRSNDQSRNPDAGGNPPTSPDNGRDQGDCNRPAGGGTDTGREGNESNSGNGSNTGNDGKPPTKSGSESGNGYTTIDPRTLAERQPGDVIYTQTGQPSDEALRALIQLHEDVAPADMPSVTSGSAEQTGWADLGDTIIPQSGAIDPKALAAQQPGDVLSAPASPISDEALRALIQLHDQAEPMDMPAVSVPEGQWGTGEWVAMDIRPDGPAGSVPPDDQPERA
ncbi:hypothetical protein [Acrocarpospora catenulata]|uniref:hypothetical protein n=1 Tax=Acrocarpospora catenulata TaxID=2836182 RepID=UPI001BD97D5F|nr:hypothetical protein [Acrocarpospora catenulata]